MMNAESATRSVAAAYLPEMNAATGFEREILNARINFIYHVTIQKPGTLDAGWKRFGKAQGWLPELQKLAQKAELKDVQGETEQLARDLAQYEVELRNILDRVATGRNKDADFGDVIKSWAALGNKLVDTAGELNRKSAAVAEQESAEHSLELRRGVVLTGIGGLVAVGLAAGIAFLLTRGITRTLRHVVGELHAAVKHMAGASQEVAQASRAMAEGSTEQSASVVETSSSCEEISAMARRSAEGAGRMAGQLDGVNRASQTGTEAVAEMVLSMRDVIEASGSMSKIIRVIDEIAFQTNVLALNAAVEAARAGEAGMGFAVVADEVRTLAQRSAEAARQTAELIGQSVEKTAASQRQMERMAESMGEIAAGASEAREIADQVSAGSAEQSQGFAHIVTAISEIETVTQRMAAGAEETAAAAAEIAGQADAMHGIAGELAELVGHAA